MMHDLYLKHTGTLVWAPPVLAEDNLQEHNFVDIMYCPEKGNANDDQKEGVKIGSIMWILYKQEIAIANGINMTQLPGILPYPCSESLLELDYAHISQETIDEIGAASHPNIVIIFHFGIHDAYRNQTTGIEVMKKFIEQMKGICGYVIIFQNELPQFTGYYAPDLSLEKPDIDPESLDREFYHYKLNAFWQRCGFRLFKDYDYTFICNVDKASPVHSKTIHSAS